MYCGNQEKRGGFLEMGEVKEPARGSKPGFFPFIKHQITHTTQPSIWCLTRAGLHSSSWHLGPGNSLLGRWGPPCAL